MKIGSIDVLGVLDGIGHMPLDAVVQRSDGGHWDCPHHPTDESGKLEMAFGGYLVTTGDRLVLVDAGIGRARSGGGSGGQLPDNLRAMGVEMEDITDVVFTHLHFDHVGWATQQGAISFPRATYRVHAADWDHFVTNGDAGGGAVRKLSPLESRLETFDSEIDIAPGLVARPAPGHTPGSTIFVVADRGERALLLGDVVHAVGELTDPEWEGLFDLDPVAARAARDAVADEVARTGDAIAAAHFPGLQFGRLVVASTGRNFTYV